MSSKIINGLLIFVLTLLAGAYFFFAMELNAEPPNYDQYNYRSSPHSVEKKSNVNTAVDDVINLILKQGFAGAIIVCLGVWTFRTDKANRAMQKENFEKLAEVTQDCSGHMASVSARLENLEREVESMKQIELMKGRS